MEFDEPAKFRMGGGENPQVALSRVGPLLPLSEPSSRYKPRPSSTVPAAQAVQAMWASLQT